MKQVSKMKFFAGLCGFAALREKNDHAKAQRRKESCLLKKKQSHKNKNNE